MSRTVIARRRLSQLTRPLQTLPPVREAGLASVAPELREGRTVTGPAIASVARELISW